MNSCDLRCFCALKALTAHEEPPDALDSGGRGMVGPQQPSGRPLPFATPLAMPFALALRNKPDLDKIHQCRPQRRSRCCSHWRFATKTDHEAAPLPVAASARYAAPGAPPSLASRAEL
eukprot:CAMPEP_0180749950 /NCGR_PEP_ID=MMETSP1038_2-20121128/30868_1 /TAXON_ID=632150 /ORGANISM="Azadinium spinosum, Strain 3D9" /LENGTH=117 /DNA_ID=CAMNT_0022783695 /DNA_START=722 /DNA_END=1076 /DNA_ORIENTATION=-